KNNGVPVFPANSLPPLKVPSGQDTIKDSPFEEKRSTLDIASNTYMLTSGGTGAVHVGANGSTDTANSKILFSPGEVADQTKLANVQKGMVITSTDVAVPNGVTVKGIITDNGTIVGVTTDGPQLPAATGKSFNFDRVPTDYVTTRLIDLWYT